MISIHDIDISAPLTDEQKKMLEEMERAPVTYDEDCPELTEKQLAELKRIAAERREERRKQCVTLRLSAQALEKAKALGKGYTSVLSRILESALNDNELLMQYM